MRKNIVLFNIHFNTGSLYASIEEYESASEIFIECLGGMVDTFGERHLASLMVMQSLGHVCVLQQRWQDAEDMFGGAFNIMNDVSRREMYH